MFPSHPECRNCGLYRGIKSIGTPTAGNESAEILIIGEANGRDEDACGIPFVGKSGRLLRYGLQNTGITDFAITNVCRCRPPHNRPPTQQEADACIHYTYEDIAKMSSLKLIVAVGNIALRTLTGKQQITKVSGEEWEYEKIKLMPLMHPSYILQNQDKELNRFYDHVARIPRIIKGGLSNDDDKGTYNFITTITEWRCTYNKLQFLRRFAYDLETTGLNPFDTEARITCIGFGLGNKQAHVLPITGWNDDEWKEIYSNLVTLFSDKKIGKVGQNIKFDNLWMKVILNIDVRGTEWDTKIAEYLLTGKGSTGLKDMAWRYSKLGGYEKCLLPDSPEKCTADELWEYNATDVDLTDRIYHQQKPRLKKQEGVHHLFSTLLVPVSDVLMRMEYHGIKIDKEKILESNKECEGLVEDLKHQMSNLDEVKAFEEAEEKTFNPNSHKQVAYILYKIQGLDVIKKTEKGQQPSTDKEVLEHYASDSKLESLQLDYSSYEQMRKTFLSELLDNERNDRIHTTLWLTETATGRTSSKKPNMQNMPKGEKDILKIREAFISDPGYLLCEADLNQHELRVMAEMANDDVLKEALKGDIHRATAATALGIKPENVTSAQRDRPGKTINFGLIYGLTSYGLKNQVGCSEEEAELMLFRFFEKYFMTKRFMEETNAFCKKYGYVEALSGRRRYFPSWEESDERKLYNKEAINFPIQATASDILLYGAIEVDRLLRRRKSFLVLEVHDSLLINLHKSELDLIPSIKEVMTTYFKQFMPFESSVVVDISLGENWGAMEKIGG